MRRPAHAVIAVVVSVLVSGCSSSQPPPAAPPRSRTEPTIAALRLGHYASADGTVGLILERRDHGARVKLDGTTQVIELDATPGVTGRTDYIVAAGRVLLHVYDDGRATIFLAERPGGIALHRDGDVDLVDGSVAIKPAGSPCCKDGPPSKDQPPEVKLKLGHYRNARRGIGLVFDRTGAAAKLRFDGTAEILKLDHQPGTAGRTDFIRRAGVVVLQQWEDGRVVVYLADAPDGIEVRRDGDADPL